MMRWPWQPRTEDRQAVGGYTQHNFGADRGAGDWRDATSIGDGCDSKRLPAHSHEPSPTRVSMVLPIL